MKRACAYMALVHKTDWLESTDLGRSDEFACIFDATGLGSTRAIEPHIPSRFDHVL